MKYKISIITFLDILGFRKIVEGQKNPAKIREILYQLKRFSKPDEDLSKLYEQKFYAFSDTVIRTTNILSSLNKKHQIGIVFHELLDILHMQINLVHQGIFIRGSVTIDKIYSSSNCLFGPGLINAYDLERNKAIYPRIMVDSGILKLVRESFLLKANHHNYKEEIKYIKNIIKRSKDKVWFIDYLNASESEFDEPYEYLLFIENHKNKIIENIKKNQKDIKAKRKYLWLKRYHNESVKKRNQKYGYNMSELLIYNKEIT